MAVRIGYGIYRRAMEDSFHLEHIKEELYRGRDREADKDEDIALRPHEKEREEQKIQTEETAIFGTGATDIKSEQFWRDSCRQSMDDKNEKFRNKKEQLRDFEKNCRYCGGKSGFEYDSGCEDVGISVRNRTFSNSWDFNYGNGGRNACLYSCKKIKKEKKKKKENRIRRGI